MKLSVAQVKKKLHEVLDPELRISIIDMELVYSVTIDSSKVKILMTLTTMGCPLISVIEEDIKNKIHELGVLKKNITVDLTFDPPWSMDKMSKSAKAKLGI